jgi:hypothetical protein
MKSKFPGAIPEIPVRDINEAQETQALGYPPSRHVA